MLDLGRLPGTSTWRTTVNVTNGSVWFNSTSRFLFWGNVSGDVAVDHLWIPFTSWATIEIFSGAVARPQVVTGTSGVNFIWDDILEASNIDGNFAVDSGAGSGWRFVGSGAPGTGEHSTEWGFPTVSWRVVFTA